ncbi:uncharacterized protein CDAR_506121 [Caerostris darwini]|uniref:Uncharacterized protein n=1 Tax=Caerostris darwini TaxID=1538125 RepID=A0AAV4WL34_9ARAC|nr:uncharacterized protein CDAR_506121 [Caerostris darwini]
MKPLVYIIVFFVAALSTSLGKQDNDKSSPVPETSSRRGRIYDSFFNPESFADNHSSTEVSDEPIYSDAGSSTLKPSRVDDQFPDFSVHKKYNKFPSLDHKYTPAIPNFKGISYYPYIPDNENAIAFPTEEQIVDMMSMMNAMNKLQVPAKKEEQGFLAQIASDPKTYILAAIIPLAIMMASFIPFVTNYFTAAPSGPSVLTTIANSKMARAVRDSDLAENVLGNLREFGSKVLEDDDCIQKAICEIALHKAGPDNVSQAAFIISRVAKEDWLKNFGAKELISALEKASCENVCNFSDKKIAVKKQ